MLVKCSFSKLIYMSEVFLESLLLIFISCHNTSNNSFIKPYTYTYVCVCIIYLLGVLLFERF